MQPLRILYIEPPSRVRDALAAALVRNGCEVELASSTGQAKAALRASAFDAIVLDYPGERTLRWLTRPDPADVPVVLLCGLAEAQQIRIGYRAGATLCVPRPVDAISLVAHVEALLARCAPRPREPRLGDVSLDPRRAVIAFPNGRTVQLNDQQVQILLLLAQARAPVAPPLLIKALWPSAAPSDAINRLRVVMSRLRSRLGPFASIVRSVSRSGYVLLVDLKVQGMPNVGPRARSSRPKRKSTS